MGVRLLLCAQHRRIPGVIAVSGVRAHCNMSRHCGTRHADPPLYNYAGWSFARSTVHPPAHEPAELAAPGLRQASARQPAPRAAPGRLSPDVCVPHLRLPGRLRHAGRVHQAARLGGPVPRMVREQPFLSPVSRPFFSCLPYAAIFRCLPHPFSLPRLPPLYSAPHPPTPSLILQATLAPLAPGPTSAPRARWRRWRWARRTRGLHGPPSRRRPSLLEPTCKR